MSATLTSSCSSRRAPLVIKSFTAGRLPFSAAFLNAAPPSCFPHRKRIELIGVKPVSNHSLFQTQGISFIHERLATICIVETALLPCCNNAGGCAEGLSVSPSALQTEIRLRTIYETAQDNSYQHADCLLPDNARSPSTKVASDRQVLL